MLPSPGSPKAMEMQHVHFSSNKIDHNLSSSNMNFVFKVSEHFEKHEIQPVHYARICEFTLTHKLGDTGLTVSVFPQCILTKTHHLRREAAQNGLKIGAMQSVKFLAHLQSP
ncbi:hypothetical protein VNO77_00279 [Canavalia gladiata]|uniref:Uncharacterized protein n=1 Tax=Canavalia gladiata TaxID=3824 RepID=A0AAN9R3V4_CANGL